MRNLHRCHCLEKINKYEKTAKRYQLGSNGPPPSLSIQRVRYSINKNILNFFNEKKLQLWFYLESTLLVKPSFYGKLFSCFIFSILLYFSYSKFLLITFSWISSKIHTAQKMKFSIKDFSSKLDQICGFLLEKSLMENFFFFWSDKACRRTLELYNVLVQFWFTRRNMELDINNTNCLSKSPHQLSFSRLRNPENQWKIEKILKLNRGIAHHPLVFLDPDPNILSSIVD